MATQPRQQLSDTNGGSRHRALLLSGLPVTERRLQVAGVLTAVLEGGAGPPILLLHGPGDFAGMWMRVIPDLVTTHRVVAPDLPGHGTSELVNGRLDADGLRAWLSGLIERTCPSPPVLVGHVLGGAIGARFAVNHSDRLSRLVLVDSLGLARFRPAPKFALTMLAFLTRPTDRTYTRFMRQCSFDLDGLRHELGPRWEPSLAYSLERARGPSEDRRPAVSGVRDPAHLAGRSRTHRGSYHADLGPARSRQSPADRPRRQRSLRMAASRDRELCG
jgi:pimeloyl-ACP methyl ester carboxylesterase